MRAYLGSIDAAKAADKESKMPAKIAEQKQLFTAIEAANPTKMKAAKLVSDEDIFIAIEVQILERPTFEPHPDLAHYLIPMVKKRWEAIPTYHLYPPPYVGQKPQMTVRSFADGFDYLQDYAYHRGFAVVRDGSPGDGSRWQVKCIRHGEKTRNT